MRVGVIRDGREITVKAVRFPYQTGTVLYTCSPSDTETIGSHRAGRTADKVHLVSILREHLAGMGAYPRTNCRYPVGTDLPIQVVHDPLGRPQLRLGDREGPAVSFSESGGKLWAALCGDVSDIGIDAVGTNEFPKEYPFHRAFLVQELQQAFRLTG